MKLTHKTHGWTPDRTDPEWAAAVEREVSQQTARRDALWAKAQRRYARAQQRLDTARAAKPDATTTHRLAKLEQQVDDRLRELREIECLMMQTPAGSQHRGRGSYRGVA
jgi:ribosomal protein L44E